MADRTDEATAPDLETVDGRLPSALSAAMGATAGALLWALNAAAAGEGSATLAAFGLVVPTLTTALAPRPVVGLAVALASAFLLFFAAPLPDQAPWVLASLLACAAAVLARSWPRARGMVGALQRFARRA